MYFERSFVLVDRIALIYSTVFIVIFGSAFLVCMRGQSSKLPSSGTLLYIVHFCNINWNTLS